MNREPGRTGFFSEVNWIPPDTAGARMSADTRSRARRAVAGQILARYHSARPGSPKWTTAARELDEALPALGLADDPPATEARIPGQARA